MSISFNPLIYSGFDLTGTGGGSVPPGASYILVPVNTAANLPLTAPDGAIVVVKDTDTLYIFDGNTSTWKAVNPPSTDIPRTSVVVPDSATDAVIPGFIFDASVLSAQAIVSVVDQATGNQENIVLLINKGNTAPQRVENRVGDTTPVVFSVALVGSQIQVYYHTQAGSNNYTINFKAFTLN